MFTSRCMLMRPFAQRSTKKMSGYGFVLSQIVSPITLCMVFGPASLVCWWLGYITAADRQVPVKSFALMAILYNAELYVGLPASANLSGPVQTVLSGFRVPITMATSAIIVRARYRLWPHGVAALLVVVAAVIVAAPSLNKAGLKTSAPLFMLIKLVQMAVPTFVVEERIVKAHAINAVYFRFMVGVWQIVMALVLVPVVFVDLPGRKAVAPSEFFPMLRSGVACFFGSGVAPAADAGVTCDGMWQLWTVFSFMAFVDGSAAVVVRKYGSAALAAMLGGGLRCGR